MSTWSLNQASKGGEDVAFAKNDLKNQSAPRISSTPPQLPELAKLHGIDRRDRLKARFPRAFRPRSTKFAK